MDTVIRLNAYAKLVQSQYGTIYVEFGSRHYMPQELVPFDIFGNKSRLQSNLATMTAADFVVVCMAEKFGQISEWPALAHAYLSPKTRRIAQG
jgi:hypothetical protein